MSNVIDEFRLNEKVIIVTGAARGIGLEMAKAVLEAGASVYAVDISETPADFEEYQLSQRGKDSYDRICYRQLDTTSQDMVKKLFAEISSKHGRLDGLIAAAGINREIPFLEFDLKSWNDVLNVDLTAIFITGQAAAQEMVRTGTKGRILFVASVAGDRAVRTMYMSAYHAAKAGVQSLARSMAYELAPHQIRVNYINPGITHTSMTQRQLDVDPSLAEKWTRQNCFNRLAQMSEMKGATVFLMSDASSFVHGQGINIDGGATIF